MKKLLICLFTIASTTHAQVPLAASYFKEAEAAAQKQKLWKIPLYGPTLFVDQESRLTYANMPDSAGILKHEGGIYTGLLPTDVMVANTAIKWGGRTWSVLLWPLPEDRNERVGLLLHESFHCIQQQIGFPAKSPTADHLSTMEGRLYLFLELQALKAALQKPVNRRQTDLANALAFRQKREQLFPKTFANERILEMNEGLAEYTGASLGRSDLRPHLYAQIDTAGNRKSLIRSFAYLTGPVYGLLLQEKSRHWTQQIDSNADFSALIKRYYRVKASNAPNELTYNGAAIRSSEQQKESIHLQAAKAYTEIFTQKPVLRIKLVKMNIIFNPNTLFDLGNFGTIYPTGEIKDNWGHLQVNKGGMLLKDWRIVSVPVNGRMDVAARHLEGEGWTLDLAEGWHLIKIDNLHYTLSSN
ncbi:hypothetical protein LT679_01685 [Mucilaginibacter roseus]|uniref:DUF1570 domain-containing protein n=1 Tax=Mucilaginibacter roseus TaxID=1528868 RepID=A0ABS8U0L8_9SPHI|nr:hypothetical protein [Mucilaginibacter roseus]MCD8739299.1 hypothetical protein [Mucilaginibacter roseus]